ncbi:hypothetical protein [Glycomyces paridis]|uniref:Uncharacterized protein n=1 Tax=Glycomyces paridis TaxID=2126555 RepID=A0A4S8PQQ3_9ACTN|nr:hypothetical protein [Glycomyces paridis]THV30634.1 hypothetical protein E9998_04395 [Glycomyces paridis]
MSQVGIFGVIGRETRGAFRSIGYDLQRSRRFRRIGVIAVATVAGGVIATGALVREPVPEMIGLGEGGEGADIIEGWFGLGADTAGQDAETSEAPSQSPSGEPAAPTASDSATESEPQGRTRNSRTAPAADPGLVQVGGEDTATPGGEEGGSSAPTQVPTEEPTEEPTTDGPTGGPTQEPTSEPPTTDAPAPSETVTVSPEQEQAARNSAAPEPRKAPIGG